MTSNHDFTPDDQEQDDAGLQLDAYGLKGKIRPAQIGDEEVTSLKDLGESVQLSLLNAADQSVKLIADIPKAARSLLRGLVSLPGSLSKRISQAHRKADKGERDRQQLYLERQLLPLDPEQVEHQLKEFIERKRAEGWCVVIERHIDGGTLLAIVRPDLEQAARALAHQSITRKALPPNSGMA